MRAFVTVELASDRLVELAHGDIVGRLATCACPIDDPRISEAHALVSLRGAGFKLLALRGRFGVVGAGGDVAPAAEVALSPGLTVQLARGIALDVVDVELPATVLALEGDTLPRQVLAGVTSLVDGPRVSLVAGYRADAALIVWSNGRQWRARAADVAGEGTPLEAGAELACGAHRLRAVAVPLAQGGADATSLGAEARPIHLVVRYPTAHVVREGEAPAAIDGLPARILGELAAFGVPTPWELLVRELWPGDEPLAVLRRRFDVALARLRRRLREIGVRADLVRADGSGSFELLLARGDTIETVL